MLRIGPEALIEKMGYPTRKEGMGVSPVGVCFATGCASRRAPNSLDLERFVESG